MKADRTHRLSTFAARAIAVLLLLQFLLPPGLSPARAALSGADGTFLPTAFCALPPGHGSSSGEPDDRHARDHCVLCRLPASSSLGLGAVKGPALAGVGAYTKVAISISPDALEPGRAQRSFLARAPPFSLLF